MSKTAKDKLQASLRLFQDFLSEYEKANPDFLVIATAQIVHDSLNLLKGRIEDPEEKEIAWDNPFCEIQYSAPWDWERGNLTILELNGEDVKDKATLPGKLADGFIWAKHLYAFRALTHDVYILKKGDRGTLFIPESLKQELEKLSKKKQEAFRKKVQEGFTFELKVLPVGTLSSGKKIKLEGTASVTIYPLLVDADAKRAYYPVIAGLVLRGTHLRDLTDENRREIWDGVLKAIREATPEESFDWTIPTTPKEPPPVPVRAGDSVTHEEAITVSLLGPRETITVEPPVVKPVGTELVKVSLRAEIQKWGKKPKGDEPSLFDNLDKEEKEDALEHRVEVVGIDNTIAQNKALYAIQVLLHRTDYKGNLPGQILKSTAFSFSGYLPGIKFTPSEYLEAYRVGTRETERGKYEYNANERAEALRALRDLHDKRYLFVYERKYWIKDKKTGKRKELFDLIRTVRPLITITEGYEALTKTERDQVAGEGQTQAGDSKLKVIALEPCPILVDQINTYFVLKPANYKQEIGLLVPHASKYVYNFIDYLMAKGELHRRKDTGWTIRIGVEGLAYTLHMDSWVKNHQWKQIRGSLDKCYKTAKDLGYLSDHKTIQGKTKDLEELTLNPEKFGKKKEIEAQIAEPELQA